ncbi:MAG: hypothetical protein WDW38_008285 [Sanguina aurantia]
MTGFGAGSGFGVGLGFGGGGCGIGFGLGWGYGAAFGSQYLVIQSEFDTSRKEDKRPQWLKQLQDKVTAVKVEKSLHKNA